MPRIAREMAAFNMAMDTILRADPQRVKAEMEREAREHAAERKAKGERKRGKKKSAKKRSSASGRASADKGA